MDDKDISELLASAQQGQVLAQFQLSEIYCEGGSGVSQDFTEAMKWLQLVAGQSGRRELQSRAQHQIAHMYYNGKGVPKDERTALNWFHLAAENGTPDAQHALGNSYFNGEGVKQSYAEAMKWYLRALAQGGKNFGITHEKVALMFFYGLGTPQDYKESLKLYQESVDLFSSDDARERIGFMYQHGLGVQQDYKEAARWYSELWGTNHFVSARLGYMYQYGLGVTRDYKEAHRHYLNAGPDWSTEVLRNLGLMYEFGLGVPIDRVLAYVLYTLTAVGFHSWEVFHFRPKLEERMTSEEIARGDSLTEELKAANSDRIKNYLSNAFGQATPNCYQGDAPQTART